MVNRHTYEAELRVLSMGMHSELETIIEYYSFEYILGAHRTRYGRDARSLKTRIIKLQDCDVPNDSRPKAIYDDRTKIIRVEFDKSKIIPLSDSGYIVFEVSGNYEFIELIKLPWIIEKTPLKVKNEWIKINKNQEEPVTWITGNVSVAKISFILPDDINDNKIWYQILNPTIEFVGQGSNSYKIKSDSELSYEKEYDVQYNCIEALDSPEERSIKIKFKDASQDDEPQVLSVKFIPAIRLITASLKNCKDEYTLGSSDTALAKLTLSSECQDVHANTIVKIGITSMIGDINYDNLITIDELTPMVKVNQTKPLIIRINSEKLKQLPDNDVAVTIAVESQDTYTEANFTESFNLKV